MFYTDGSNVYDAFNRWDAQWSGLLGSPSANQPVAVCPVPGQPNKYFYFRSKLSHQQRESGSITYEVVDMAHLGNSTFPSTIPLAIWSALSQYRCRPESNRKPCLSFHTAMAQATGWLHSSSTATTTPVNPHQRSILYTSAYGFVPCISQLLAQMVLGFKAFFQVLPGNRDCGCPNQRQLLMRSF